MKRFFLVAILLINQFTISTLAISGEISRNSGVAPLSVHFAATLTPSNTENEHFHDYNYTWTFGDSSSGNWYNGDSKNTGKGPIAEHTYEMPGTYNAVLVVRDSTTGNIVSGLADSFTITVTDPETIFATTKTTCISSTSNYTGCPSGANHATSLSALPGATDAGERVLLRRGDSWTISSSPSFPDNTGPVSIGAYGECTSPDERGICSNAPDITLTGSGTGFLVLSKKWDWRIVDLYIHGTTGTTGIILGGGQDLRNTLVSRIKATGGSSAYILSQWRDNDNEYIWANTVSNCWFDDFYSMVVFAGGEKNSIVGNRISNSTVSHALRVWFAYQNVIEHNLIFGGGSGEHSLKLHGTTPIGETGSVYVGTYADVLAAYGEDLAHSGQRQLSQFIVVSDNVFGASGSWMTSIEPQNGGYYEPIYDLIYERNISLADYSDFAHDPTNIVARFSAQYASIRNNILDCTGGDTYCNGIQIEQRGIEPVPVGLRVYNNTIYTQNTQDQDFFNGVAVHDGSDVIIRNNYVSAPNAAMKNTVSDSTGNATATNNVFSATPGLTDPDNANPLARDFQLTASATAAIEQGYTVPVLDDFAGSFRTAPYDIGAFEYSTSEEEPSSLGGFILHILSGSGAVFH